MPNLIKKCIQGHPASQPEGKLSNPGVGLHRQRDLFLRTGIGFELHCIVIPVSLIRRAYQSGCDSHVVSLEIGAL